MAKIQRSLYEGAPGILMDRIHEVNALLANSQLKTGQTESWKFWKRTSDIMKYAWDYMQNLNWVLKENYALKEENLYLRAALAHKREINMHISVLTHLKLTGEFDERVKLVDEIMALGVNDLGGIFRG